MFVVKAQMYADEIEMYGAYYSGSKAQSCQD